MFQGCDVPDGVHLRLGGRVSHLSERGPAAAPGQRGRGSGRGGHVRPYHDAGAVRGPLHDGPPHGAVPRGGWYRHSLQMVRERARQ